MSELYDHVLKLAEEVGVPFIVKPNLCEEGWLGDLKPGETCGLAHVSELFEGVPQGIVFLSVEPRERMAYLLALHELGHIAYAKYTDTFRAAPLDGRDTMDHEAGAWHWALRRSLFEPNACEWGEIAWRMKTYRVKSFESLIAEAEGKSRVTEESHAGHAGETDGGGSAGPAPAEPDTAGAARGEAERGSGEPLEPGREAPEGDRGPGAEGGVAGAAAGRGAAEAVRGKTTVDGTISGMALTP